MPKISAIITTFNRASFLPKTIESVLQQTYTDFELIVIDDGSTDTTKAVLSPWLSHIHYIYQKNQGTSAAKNRGIHKATGDYITFLDSDDLWDKDKLRLQLDFMQTNPSLKISYTDEQWVRNGKKVNIPDKHHKYSGYIFKEALENCFIGISTVMLRKELFNEIGIFDERLPICEDYDLWLRILQRYPITLLDQKLTVKQGGHPDQLSTSSWGMDRFRVIALKKQLKQNKLNQIPHTPDMKPYIKKLIFKKNRILRNGAIKRKRYLSAVYYWITTYI